MFRLGLFFTQLSIGEFMCSHGLTVIPLFPLQWKIYDAYVEELQKQEKNKEKQKAVLSKKDNEKSKKKMMVMETQVNWVLTNFPA